MVMRGQLQILKLAHCACLVSSINLHQGPHKLQIFSQWFLWKNRYKTCCPYIKLLKNSLQLWKEVVVCMDNNFFFSFSCSVRGPSGFLNVSMKICWQAACLHLDEYTTVVYMYLACQNTWSQVWNACYSMKGQWTYNDSEFHCFVDYDCQLFVIIFVNISRNY